MNKFIFYLIISFVAVSAFMAFAMFSPDIDYAWGFFGWVVFYVLSILFSALGALVGRFFRDMAAPDAFLSTGLADTVMTKLFWSMGPQAIGWFIGFSIGGYLTTMFFL